MLPAYAGMIRSRSTPSMSANGAPRVCGDDPGVLIGKKPAYSCSPRMRG